MISKRILIAASMLGGSAVFFLGSILWQEKPAWRGDGSATAASPSLSSGPSPAITLSAGDRIIALGDSLTAGIHGGWARSGQPYPEVLQERLGGAVHVLNLGVGGETSAQGLARIDTTDRAALAIVMYGTNDAAVRGWLASRQASGVDAYREALVRIADTFRKGGTEVLILAPPVPGSIAMERRLRPYRAAAKEAAQQSGAHFLDAARAFQNVDAPLQRDGLHLNAFGNRALGNWLANCIAIAAE